MHSFRRLLEYLHDDPQPTANLDSTGSREQPEPGPGPCGTENKELNPSNSGGFSLIWTALGLAPPLRVLFMLKNSENLSERRCFQKRYRVLPERYITPGYKLAQAKNAGLPEPAVGTRPCDGLEQSDFPKHRD